MKVYSLCKPDIKTDASGSIPEYFPGLGDAWTLESLVHYHSTWHIARVKLKSYNSRRQIADSSANGSNKIMALPLDVGNQIFVVVFYSLKQVAVTTWNLLHLGQCDAQCSNCAPSKAQNVTNQEICLKKNLFFFLALKRHSGGSEVACMRQLGNSWSALCRKTTETLCSSNLYFFKNKFWFIAQNLSVSLSFTAVQSD